jgi:hypothetical protein
VRAYPLVPRILCGEGSENRKPRTVFVANTREENLFTSIQLRPTLHPSHTGVKGTRTENRGNLNPAFREVKKLVLLGAGRGEKWGLSGIFGSVCLRQRPVSPVPPKPAPRAAKRGQRRPPSDGRGAPGGVRARGLSRAPTARGAVRGQDGEDQPVPGRPVGRRPVLGQLLVGLATDDDRIGGAQLLQPMRPGLASGSNRPSSRSMTPSTFTCADTISRPIRTFLPSRGLGATPGR